MSRSNAHLTTAAPGFSSTAVKRRDGLATSADLTWTYRAFGITWNSEFPWPGVPSTAEVRTPTASVELGDEARLEKRWSGHAGERDWLLRIDGRPFLVQRGSSGDFRLIHNAGATFHVSSDGTLVTCVGADRADDAWKRVLLDTVLWSTALLHGFEALHASGVEDGGGVIAFLGSMGGGKTTLALEFVRRGYRLFCDDVLTLERYDAGVVAHPSPPLLNVPASAASEGAPIRSIARLGGEVWCATRGSDSPARIAHLFLLERADGLVREVVPVSAGVFELRRHALVHGLLAGRERARFEVCSDLVEQVSVHVLRADLKASPMELADLVERTLDRVAGAAR
jgi:hypothetical protein